MKNSITYTKISALAFGLMFGVMGILSIAPTTVSADAYDDSWYTYDNSYSYDDSWYSYDNSYSYDDSWYSYDNSYSYDDSWYSYDNSYSYDDSWYSYDNSYSYDYDEYYADDWSYDYDYDYSGWDYSDYDYSYDYDYDYDYSGWYGSNTCSSCNSGSNGGTVVINNNNVNNNTNNNNNNNDDDDDEDEDEDLEVICYAEDTRVEVGDTVVWRAEVDGGNGNYSYNWSGTNGLSGNSRTVSIRYNSDGTKSASVTVRSAGQTESANCGTVVVEDEEDDDDDDLEVICRATPSRAEVGERVTWRAEADGGGGDYRYDWSGDADGDDRTVYETYRREGRYEAEVTVRSRNGDRETAECSIRVEDEDDDSNVHVTTTVTKPPQSTISSVYLSQVPYTGPEDMAGALAILGLGTLLSFYGFYLFMKRKNVKARKNAIEAFKQANLEKKTA